MSYWLAFSIALGISIALPLQPLLNARLGMALGSTLLAAMTNFLIGLLLISVILIVTSTRLPGPAQLSQVQLWMLAGGLIGASLVTGSAFIVPKLGALVLTAVVVAGQLCAAMLYDHYGVMRAEPDPITLQRVLGVMLLIAGVVLVQRG